jgi:hypothetical protein
MWKTLHALLTILLRIAAQQPVLFIMEDLHWVDPSTLELLTLLVDQGPTARILALFTFRPDFSPPAEEEARGKQPQALHVSSATDASHTLLPTIPEALCTCSGSCPRTACSGTLDGGGCPGVPARPGQAGPSWRDTTLPGPGG